MKKNKEIQAQKIEKTHLVEGINNLIEEKTQKVEKSKKALKAEAKKEETPEAAKEKKVKKTQKEKLVDKTKKKVEANLVEEVVTKREVKYIYPADCEDTLSRKSSGRRSETRFISWSWQCSESRTRTPRSSRKQRRSTSSTRTNSSRNPLQSNLS